MTAPVASPAVERWIARFDADPVAALGDLLAGRVALGAFGRARPSETLVQILDPVRLPRADLALRDWLEQVIGAPASEDLPGKRFADALADAFRAIALIPLPESRAWCAANQGRLRAWLRAFYFGHSRDPEAALLATLTQSQPDRHLLGLWLGLTRLSGGVSPDYARIGITGLRLMPADDQGRTEHRVPAAMLRGVLEFGEALARRNEDLKGKTWLAELDYLAAVYPMSVDQWEQRLRESLQARDVSRRVRNWLDQRYPRALELGDRNQRRQHALKPPTMEEQQDLLRRLPNGLDSVRSDLSAFFDRHRVYCRESGDSYYMVHSFCHVGARLLERDPIWARELAHEAARWSPQDPHPWSILARALDAEGDWSRAQAVFWHARRRFPQNAQSHHQLAHALVQHGETKLGAAIYRAAIRLFPKDTYSWADLAHTLRVSGQRERAAEVYREAQQLFPKDPVIITGRADNLIDLDELDEAQQVLAWADQLDMDDRSAAQREVARRRLYSAQSGKSMLLKTTRRPVEGPGGDLGALCDITGEDLSYDPALGRAILLRRSLEDNLDRAREEIDTLPPGTVRLAEECLWHAASDGWRAAADWLDIRWERYAGDGVLRVHRQRAHARAGDQVDWSLEQQRYPYLRTVIETEMTGAPPARLKYIDTTDEDLTAEQRQDAWFNELAGRDDQQLRDHVEEDVLSSRHLLS